MLDRHLNVVSPQRERAPKTIIGYRSLCKNQIYPRWGGQRIDRLLPEQLEDGYAEMRLAAWPHPPFARFTPSCPAPTKSRSGAATSPQSLQAR
jgi:hypothetical protein